MTRKPHTSRGTRIATARDKRVAAWLLVAFAAAPAFSARLGLGVVVSTDAPMLFAALAAGVAAWLAWRTSGRPRGPAGSEPASTGWRLSAAALAVAGAAVVSAVASSNGFASLLGAPSVSFGVVQLSLLVLLAVCAAYSATLVRKTLLAFGPWLLAAQILIVGWQAATGSEPVGAATNSTFMSQTMLLTLPLAVGAVLSGGDTRSRKVVAAATTALVVAVLLAAQAYAGAFLGAAYALVVVSPWPVRMGARTSRIPVRTRAALLVTGLAALTAAPLATLAMPSTWERLASRPYLWEAALEVFAARPILGAGPDAYRVAAAPLVSEQVTAIEGFAARSFGTLAGDPHNTLLWVLACGGILGVAATVWFGYEAVSNWFAQPAARNPSSSHWWPATAFVLYLATGGLAPLPLQTAVLAALVLGASLRPRIDADRPRPLAIAASGRTAVVLLTLVSALLLAHASTRLWIGAPSSPAAQAERASRAADTWSDDGFLHFFAARQAALDGAPGAARVALEYSARAVALEPANAFYRTDRALFLSMYSGDHTLVMDAFTIAEELFPASLEVPVYRGRYLLRRGMADAALRDVERALELAPSSPAVAELAAQAERAKAE